jgi:translation initiation factor IF-1
MMNVMIFDMYDPMKHIAGNVKLMKVKIEAY